MLFMLVSLTTGAAALATTDALIALVKGELRSPSSYLLRDRFGGAARIEEACRELESASPTPAWPRDLMVLDGRWRLLYSSSLALPLPPVDPLLSAVESLPLAPRDVEQCIDVVDRRVVNVVSLAPWPAGPADFMAALPVIGETLATLQKSAVTLELDHTFTVEGEGGSSGGARKAAAGSVVELRLEEVRRTLSTGGADGDVLDTSGLDMLNPQVRSAVRQQQQQQQQGSGDELLLGLIPKESKYSLPAPLSLLAAGGFDTPYADARVRISRSTGGVAGSALGELRIFERVGDASGPTIYSSWEEEEDALAAAAAAGETLPTWDDRWQEGGFDEAEAMDFADDPAYDDNGMPDA